MKLDIKQVNKELFSAQFVICRELEEVGRIEVEGKLLSLLTHIYVHYNEKTYEVVQPKQYNAINNSFKIMEDNQKVGEIMCLTRKTGWFSQYTYVVFRFKNKIYKAFPIGLGKEGIKIPIYVGNKQIAQINKECIVIDDLHHFQLFAHNEEDIISTIILSIYYYFVNNYKPGEKKISYKETVYIKDNNKELKSKYNPEFEKKC